MEQLKKYLSYLWPFTRAYNSAISGKLEVSWINGKKHLNSPNANYSYGKLQEVLVFGLKKINPAPNASVLILGLGGGSIIQTLKLHHKHTGTITGIELDEAVIDISKREYQLDAIENVTIVQANAAGYIKSCTTLFDLIVIDLFVDDTVPEFCFSSAFWEDIARLTAPSGQVLFNAGMNEKQDESLRSLLSEIEKAFKTKLLEHVKGINTLLICQRLE